MEKKVSTAPEALSTTELVSSIAKHFVEQLPKKVTRELIGEFIQLVEQNVIDGKKIRLDKIGILSSKERAERKGRNPQNGEPITIPASKKVVFRASKSLREKVGTGPARATTGSKTRKK